MFCEACSQQMNRDARFCCHCGRPFAARAWGFPRARLTRPQYGRMIGGVCAGFAQHYGWDPVLVRVVTVLLFLPCHIFILMAYIAAWIIMPNEPLFYVTPPPPNYPQSPYPQNPAGGGAGSVAGSAPAA